MKIAFLCNGYGGGVYRGSERYTEDLYNLLKDTFDITIYGLKSTYSSGGVIASYGMNTKPRDSFKIPWRNGRAYLESYYFCKKWYKQHLNKHFDLIINNSGFVGSYWCNKYRKKTKTPFITLERGGGREEALNFLFRPDLMLFLTETSRQHTTKWYLPKIKTQTIPIGINTKAFSKKQNASKYIKDLERPIILSTSALVGFKRIDLIIKAIKKLGRGSIIQTSTGNLKDQIVALGKKELGYRFKYVGVISREELLQLYHSCDVFVNASRKEAFGIVYLEALASNLPIVTQDDERRREVVGNSGIFVDCNDTDKFSKALSDIFNIKKDTSKYAEKYDWTNLKPQYESVVRSVAR